MMKKSKTIRKYSSPTTNRLLATITPLEKLQANTKMMLAARIDDLVQARGWGKKEFSEKVDKNPSEITRWLSGTQNFTIDTLAEIALALNMPILELFVQRPVHTSVSLTFVISMSAPPSPIQYKTPIGELESGSIPGTSLHPTGLITTNRNPSC